MPFNQTSRIGLRKTLVALLCLVGLWGCRSVTPDAPPPQEIILRASERMQSLPGFHFLIERSGAPAYLDDAETLVFRRAEGDYAAPDRAQAKVRVIGPGLIVEVDLISIGRAYWETNMLTGEWQQLPEGLGFNPATLFDSENGLHPLLVEDLSQLEYLGVQELTELPGRQLYALQGRVAGERLYELSYGMLGPQEMDLQLWIAPQTFELYRLLVTHFPTGAVEASTWQFDFWEFGTIPEIVPPME